MRIDLFQQTVSFSKHLLTNHNTKQLRESGRAVYGD